MIYKNPKRQKGFVQYLTLKVVFIILILAIFIGFIIREYLKPEIPDQLEYLPTFNESLNSDILRKKSIVKNFDQKHLDFFIFSTKPANEKGSFYILQYDGYYYSNVIVEKLKENGPDMSSVIEYDMSPKFMPDGNSIIFCRKYKHSNRGRPALYKMDLSEDGSLTNLVRLVETNDCNYSFAPDGKSIVYSTYLGIFSYNFSDKTKQLLYYCSSCKYPILVNSGDSQRLYFREDSNYSSIIKYINVTETNATEFSLAGFFAKDSKLLTSALDYASAEFVVSTSDKTSITYSINICNANNNTCKIIHISNYYSLNVSETVLTNDYIYFLQQNSFNVFPRNKDCPKVMRLYKTFGDVVSFSIRPKLE